MVVVMVGHYATVIQVSVVVVVAVARQRGCRLAAEEGAVFRALGHRLGRAGEADEAVQADHGVGIAHADVEIVVETTDTAAEEPADSRDQLATTAKHVEVTSLHTPDANHKTTNTTTPA